MRFKPAHLKLHGDVLLIFWRGVALLVVVEVVRCAGVNDGRLRCRPAQVVAVGVGQRRQEGRRKETGCADSYQLEQGEGWKQEGGRGGRGGGDACGKERS